MNNQANLRTSEQVLWLGDEGSSFETVPTMEQLIFEMGSVVPAFDPEQLQDNDSSTLGFDQQNLIQGLFKGGCKFSLKARTHAAQITAAAPAGAVPAHIQAIRAALGGMKVGAGSAITAGTANTITVTSAAGFEVGQVFGISGNGNVVPAVVESIASNDITFYPSLVTPVTSGFAVNGYNLFATEDNERTVTIREARKLAAAQHEFRGCIASSIAFKTELGKLAMIDLDFTASSGQRGALGLSFAKHTQAMAAGGHAIKNAIMIMQPTATTTRVNVPHETVEFSFGTDIEHLPNHSGENGRLGGMRKPTRGSPKFKGRVRFDSSLDADHLAQTEFRVLYAIPVGTGTGKRLVGWYMPKMIMSRAPQETQEGGRVVHDVEGIAKIVNTAAANSLAGAPIVHFLI